MAKGSKAVKLALKVINGACNKFGCNDASHIRRMENLAQELQIPFLPGGQTDSLIVAFAISVIEKINTQTPAWGSKRLSQLKSFGTVKDSGFLKKKKPRRSKPKAVMAAALAGAREKEKNISEFYSSWGWKRLRYEFIKGRNRACECCGNGPPTTIIHVDHIKPIRHYWNLRLDKSNLQLLCKDCNMGKGSHDETDWQGTNVVPFSALRST